MIIFSIYITIVSKRNQRLDEDETKIQDFSNVTKYSFNDFSIRVDEIKSVFIYHENCKSEIETSVKHDIYKRVNDELICELLINEDDVIEINDLQTIDIYEYDDKLRI